MKILSVFSVLALTLAALVDGVAQAPPNDDFANREEITGDPFAADVVVNANTADATEEAQEPDVGFNDGASIWFEWVPPTSGAVIFTTVGSGYDTVLGIFGGTVLDALVLLDSNDDLQPGNLRSEVVFSVTAGEPIQIMVSGFGGATGDVVLTLRAAPLPPANDAFANAEAIGGDVAAGPLVVNASNEAATLEIDEPDLGVAGGASVWFQWTPTQSQNIVVSTAGSAVNTLLGFFAGDEIGDLTTLSSDTSAGGSQVVVGVDAGLVYHILVDGIGGDVGTIVLTLEVAPPPPANDDFVDRELIPGDPFAAPVMVEGWNLFATSELDEPAVPEAGGNSVWYSWTATASGPVIASTEGSEFDTILAVFTGGALAELVLVGSDDNSGGGDISEIAFRATAGTTYHILLDGDEGETGNFRLTLLRSPQEEYLPLGSDWEWLHPTDAVDPGTADANFHDTWHTVASYDGPAFNGPAPALLGYGTITWGAIATNIGTPASGSRYTAYFRRTFELPETVAHLRAEVMVDDAAVIYIDGERVTNLNLAGADGYFVAAEYQGSEWALQPLDLGPVAAGMHEIAVSVHNRSVSSSDVGFDMRLFRQLPVLPVVALGDAPLQTGFEDTGLAATEYEGRSAGVELGWKATGRGVASADDGGNVMHFSQTVLGRLETEAIDARGAFGVVASLDLRTQSTGFEIDDFMEAWVEGSDDGAQYERLVDVVPFTTGGPADPMAEFGIYSTFATQVGDIPDSVAYIRLVVRVSVDETSENVYVDNVRFEASGGGRETIKVLSWDADPVAGATLVFESEGGATYDLETSPAADLSAEWTVLDSVIAAGDSAQFVIAGPLDDPRRGYYRVRKRAEE